MVDLISALGLLLILEGILPFLSPNKMRTYITAMLKMSDASLRLIGVISMLVGLVLLYLA